MIAGWELVDHAADIGVRAWGVTQSDVFEQAAFALFSLVCDPREVDERESLEISLTADSPEQLLPAWLNELLTTFEVRGLVLRQFEVLEVNEHSLRARVSGEPMDGSRHILCGGVKAATRQDVRLEPREGGWQGFVVLQM